MIHTVKRDQNVQSYARSCNTICQSKHVGNTENAPLKMMNHLISNSVNLLKVIINYPTNSYTSVFVHGDTNRLTVCRKICMAQIISSKLEEFSLTGHLGAKFCLSDHNYFLQGNFNFKNMMILMCNSGVFVITIHYNLYINIDSLKQISIFTIFSACIDEFIRV